MDNDRCDDSKSESWILSYLFLVQLIELVLSAQVENACILPFSIYDAGWNVYITSKEFLEFIEFHRFLNPSNFPPLREENVYGKGKTEEELILEERLYYTLYLQSWISIHLLFSPRPHFTLPPPPTNSR